MTTPTTSPDAYGASSIRVLSGLEAVRVRPAMYIGSTGKKGLHHLFKEVLDNSIDEAMAGHCTLINVTLDSDGETITVTDNGRGIPVEIHPDEGRSTLEVVLTVLHAGGKFEGESYGGPSGGLHGVGVSCVNALSDTLIARVWRDGGQYEQSFSRGVPQGDCARVGNSAKRGTSITFHADAEIFNETIAFDEDTLVRWFRESAFLNAGLQINFTSKKTGRTEGFRAEGGIADYVTYLSQSRSGVYPSKPFYCDSRVGKVQVQVAFQYGQEDDETVVTFANNIHTMDGGTHLSGFKTALTRIVNLFARSSGILKEKDSNLSGDDIREGLVAVMNVRLAQPQFEGQTKSKLGSVEVEGAVNSALGEALSQYFEKNPAIVKAVVERALIASKARDAAKKQAELIKRKSVFGKSVVLPEKLLDCNSEDPTRTELFLVEGDSAKGSAEDGRNSETQAILALRGKIINASKHDLALLLKNNEVQAIIACIGAGIDIGGEGFDLSKIRYGKCITLCDADDDGSHITTLILSFLWNFMPELVKGGHVYKAIAPRYKVTVGKGRTLCFSEEEKDKLVARHGEKASVVRYKGLGEMNHFELREACMDPATRRLVRVTVPDVVAATEMFAVLMGNNVAVRKAHIITRANEMAENPLF